MTTDNYFANWKLYDFEQRQHCLSRLKNDKNKKWSGDELEAVNNLVSKMERYQSENK